MSRNIFEISMFWSENNIFVERILNTLEYATLFYVAEGNESLSGHIKRDYQVPTLLKSIPEELRKKVVFVPYDFTDCTEKDPLVRERLLRDSALTAVKQNPLFLQTDVLIVQDFDEFLNPKKIPFMVESMFDWKFLQKGMRLKQHLSYYYLNNLCEEPWTLSFACKASFAKLDNFSANEWRHQQAKKKFPVSKDFMGWHHSYLGDANYIKSKLASFADSQTEIVKNVSEEQIVTALKSGKDLFGRAINITPVHYDELDPIPVLQKRSDLMMNL